MKTEFVSLASHQLRAPLTMVGWYVDAFTRLFRADNVRTKDTDGTGLGLYITKSVVDALGGEIWFQSEENRGTTFYVALPTINGKMSGGIQLIPRK